VRAKVILAAVTKRGELYVTILVSFFAFCLALAACAGDRTLGHSKSVGEDTGNNSKLGYGFQPGLVPGKDFFKGQLIVVLKKDANAQDVDRIIRTATVWGGRVVNEINGESLLLEFPSEEALLVAVPELIALTQVAFVERNGFMRVPLSPGLPDLKGKAGKFQ
jgi:hypothetical protein